MARLSELVGKHELVAYLTLRELRGRYRRSVLGWSWSLLNPLAMVLIYSLVFSLILKIQPPLGDPSGLKNFAMFLVCALVPWNLFANGLAGGMGSLVGNPHLIKRVYVPRELIVTSVMLSLVVTMVIELAVIVVVMLFFGNVTFVWLPMVLVLVLLEFFFVLGLVLTLAPWNVYFRDLEHFMAIATTLLFYVTPIVYPVRLVPKHSIVLGIDVPVAFLYRLNPMVRFVEAFRNVLYDLRFPSAATMGYLAACAVTSMAVGVFVFSRLDRRIAEEV